MSGAFSHSTSTDGASRITRVDQKSNLNGWSGSMPIEIIRTDLFFSAFLNDSASQAGDIIIAKNLNDWPRASFCWAVVKEMSQRFGLEAHSLGKIKGVNLETFSEITDRPPCPRNDAA
jgi:hypothetical protein